MLAEFGVGGCANDVRGGNVGPGLNLQDGDLERPRNQRIPTFTTNYIPGELSVQCSR